MVLMVRVYHLVCGDGKMRLAYRHGARCLIPLRQSISVILSEEAPALARCILRPAANPDTHQFHRGNAEQSGSQWRCASPAISDMAQR
jgi:hypothetical protein